MKCLFFFLWVPFFVGSKTIRWLGEEALKRYLKLKPPSFVPNRQEVVHDIRKTVGGAICDPDDILIDVLDDNDYVAIGKGQWPFLLRIA